MHNAHVIDWLYLQYWVAEAQGRYWSMLFIADLHNNEIESCASNERVLH